MTLNNNTTSKHNTILADLGLLIVAVCWGGGFVACKFPLEHMTPMCTMAYRYLAGTVFLALLCIKKLPLLKNKRLLLWGSICGINMFVGNSLQTIGLLYTTAGKQSFIVSLYILLVPIMTWIVYKKRPSNNILVAAVIGFAGITLITLTDSLTIGIGDILTFGLTLTFSAQIVFTAAVIKDIDAVMFTLVQIFVSGILALLFSCFSGSMMSPSDVISLPVPALIGLLYVALPNSAIAFALQNFCLKYAPANHASVILSMETVFGTIAAVCIAGEVFSIRMIAGCILMFIAIGTAELPNLKKSQPPEISNPV